MLAENIRFIAEELLSMPAKGIHAERKQAMYNNLLSAAEQAAAMEDGLSPITEQEIENLKFNRVLR